MAFIDDLARQLFRRGVDAAGAVNPQLADELSAALGDGFGEAVIRGNAGEYIERLRNSDGLSDDARRLLDADIFRQVERALNENRVFFNDLEALSIRAAEDGAVDEDALARLFADHSIEEGNNLRDTAQNIVARAAAGEQPTPGAAAAGAADEPAAAVDEGAAGADEAAAGAAKQAARNTGNVDGALGGRGPWARVAHFWNDQSGTIPLPRFLRGGASTAPTSSNNLLPSPQRSWMHTITSRYNPYVLIGTLFPKVSEPANYLPNELAFNRYIDPFIHAVDDRLMGLSSAEDGARILPGRPTTTANIADAMNDLGKELNNIRSRIGAGSSPITMDQAKTEALKVVNDFISSHRTSLEQLDHSLAPISDEMKLELDLAVITRRRGEKEDTRDALVVNAEARRLIQEYEARSGLTFDQKEERISAVVSGAFRQFHLESRQARAMHAYVSNLQRSANNISSSGFLTAYETALDSAISAGDDNAFIKALTANFEFLSREANGAAVRTVPQNRVASESVIWKAARNRIQDVDALKISLRQGYFNPHTRTVPITDAAQMPNQEAIVMNIEEMNLKEAGGSSTLLGNIKDLYNVGAEQDAIEALRRLNMRVGRSQDIDLLKALSTEMTRSPDYTAGSAHYRHFVDHLKELTHAPHSPYKWGQRDVLKMFGEWSFKPYHARRYPGPGAILSTPGRMFFWENPLIYTFKKAISYPLGGRVVLKENSEGMQVPQMQFFAEAGEDVTGFDRTKHYARESVKLPFKAARNLALLPIQPGYQATRLLAGNHIVRNVVGYSGGIGVAAIGIEAVLELVLPENTWFTNEEGDLIVPEAVPYVGGADWDIGSRLGTGFALLTADSVLTPIRWNAALSNSAIDSIFGVDLLGSVGLEASYISLFNNPILDLGRFNRRYLGDRGDISLAEATAALAEYEIGDDGQLAPAGAIEGTPLNLLPTVQFNALTERLADEDQPLTQENIQTAFDAVMGTGVADDDTPGAEDDAPAGDDTPSGDTPSGGTPAGSTPSPYAQVFNNNGTGLTNNGGRGFWDAAGDVVGDVYSGGADWLGAGPTISSIGSMFNSASRAATGFIGDLANNRIADGQKWLAGGIGIVAAIFGTNFLKNQLGLSNVPFVGLIIASVIFLYGGKFAHAALSGQGNGTFRPIGTNPPGVRNDGTPTPTPTRTPDVEIGADNPGRPDYPWDNVIAIDPENDGQYAVQVNAGDSQFVDFNVLSSETATPANINAAIADARAGGTFFPEVILNGRQMADPEKWQFEAIETGTDIGRAIIMTPSAADAANGAPALVLAVAG